MILAAAVLGCGPAAGETDAATGGETTDVSTTTQQPAETSTGPETDPDVGVLEPDVAAPEIECCGCLCLDDVWSCSAQTCLLADGTAAELGEEAGFFELEAVAGSIGSPPVPFTVAPHRFWYSFAPAAAEPERAPLLVFFNGGPGAATTSGLAAMNVGPRAVALQDGAAVIVDNPFSWTSFANVLFVDPRFSGFSYGSGAPARGETYPAELDAADLLRVTLRFVERHPQLADSEVTFIGESYGGLRALLIAHLVDRADSLSTGAAPTSYRDDALAQELAQFDLQRFGHYVSVQGSLVGLLQRELSHPNCPGDAYSCQEPEGALDDRFDAGARAAVDPTKASTWFGVEIETIEWMAAEHRSGASIIPETVAPDDAAMSEAFGSLGQGEVYFRRFSSVPVDLQEWFVGPESCQRLLEVLPSTRWFATDAAHDSVVYMPQLPATLGSDYPDVVDEVTVDGSGASRQITIEYLDGSESSIRFVHYPDSGHAVPAYEPQALRDHVAGWLESR